MPHPIVTMKIKELMKRSGVKFGTSGVRGLVEDMTDRVCYAYTYAFLQYLDGTEKNHSNKVVAIAYDYRDSSPKIFMACCQAAIERGYTVINAGNIPTPAIALYGIKREIPVIMVTGSHIPDDRNGIKFYLPDGEVRKTDEIAIMDEVISISDWLFNANGMLIHAQQIPDIDISANKEYITRYINFFPNNALSDMKIAVYQHSSVARQILVEIIQALGAEAIPLGYSTSFKPVDTEAIREEDIKLASSWAIEHKFDAIISADGDGDRPLIGDENGKWVRGDIIGILCAKYLSADIVVTPISSNTAVEKTGLFHKVIRTRIGSPYVTDAMSRTTRNQHHTVIGYEANGGFLTQTTIMRSGNTLFPLPTRDAVLPILAVLHLCKIHQCKVSQLIGALPKRYTYSDRVKDISSEISKRILDETTQSNASIFLDGFQSKLGSDNSIHEIDTTDGLRITLSNGDIFHLRPSGNAPELRCYTESGSQETAQLLNQTCIEIMQNWKNTFTAST